MSEYNELLKEFNNDVSLLEAYLLTLEESATGEELELINF